LKSRKKKQNSRLLIKLKTTYYEKFRTLFFSFNRLYQPFFIGDFNPSNNYSLFSVFSQDVPGLEVFETDVVLVYILWDQIDDPTGPIDVWRLLPQTRLLQQGILQYNYDFTFEDVSIFLESDFNLGSLGSGDTNNQVFRIAILPADGAGKRNLDTSNMQEVLEYLQVTESNIPRVEKN